MKIVHVLPNAGSGIESLVRSLVPHFAASGVETHLVYLSDSVAPLSMPFGTVRSSHVLRLRSNPLRTIRLVRNLFRNIEPDVVHSHSLLPSLVSALAGCPARHVRTIHSLYPYFYQSNVRSKLKRQIERWALHATTSQLVCVSNAVARSLPWSSRPEPLTIYNGVSVDRLPLPAGTVPGRKVVAVGRLEPQKAYARLLEAFSLIHKDIPDARLRIAGEGSQRQMLDQMIDTLRLRSSVQLLGQVHDVSELYRDADVLACSSDYEGLPLSVIEALCSGCPAVSTPIDAVREAAAFVDDGIRFSDDFSADSLATTMKEELLQQSADDLPRRLRRAIATRHAFSANKCAASYLGLYSRLVGMPGRWPDA